MNYPPLSDADFSKERARIQPILAFWIHTLGLSTWTIDTAWANHTKDSNEDVIADATSSWEYKNAGIAFYIPKCVTLNDTEMEAAIVHELGHLLVGPLASTYRGRKGDFEQMMEENTVTVIQQAIIWAFRAGAGDPGMEPHPTRGKKRLDKGPKRRLK